MSTPSLRRVSPPSERSASGLPIGLFDSGIGGLTVVGQIHRALPNEDLVYLGDTARVPYGTKSPATIVRFACEDAAFLVRQKVKAIVVACNTASAWSLPTLQRTFKLPIFGVIMPGAISAVSQTRNGRIGVIGTRSTIRSRAYEDAIVGLNARAKVFARACPLLVPLVEEGWLSHDVTASILLEYLTPMLRHRIDTLVLGCTHYPLLKPVIQRITTGRITLVDSAESCAEYVREALDERQLLCRTRRRKGVISPYVTDEPERFQEVAARFLKFPTERPARVDLIAN